MNRLLVEPSRHLRVAPSVRLSPGSWIKLYGEQLSWKTIDTIDIYFNFYQSVLLFSYYDLLQTDHLLYKLQHYYCSTFHHIQTLAFDGASEMLELPKTATPEATYVLPVKAFTWMGGNETLSSRSVNHEAELRDPVAEMINILTWAP